jgi:hypothetical protein
MIDQADAADSTDPMLIQEPTDSTDPAEPTEPTDSTEPTEPMDSTESFDAMLSTEFCERMDHFDVMAVDSREPAAARVHLAAGADSRRSSRAAGLPMTDAER